MSQLTMAPESLFWWWISERHSIFLRRQAGQPKPWTTDPILQNFRFTNPFREHDRGTVWLREHFLEPHRHDDLSLIAFNVMWYRMFNWTGTGEYLGWQTSWDAEAIKHKLRARLDAGMQVFTGAHIIRSEFNMPKIDSITDVCQDLWNIRQMVVDIALETERLQKVFDLLCTVHLVGPFLAYEMVTDFRHTRLLEDAIDVMTWANPGPGAQRGLQRLSLPSKSTNGAIEAMRGLLTRGNDRWPHPGVNDGKDPPLRLPQDFPKLEMRDIEHSLCEWDKYCRVKFREGAPRGRYQGAA